MIKAFLSPMEELGEFLEIRRALKNSKGMLQVTGCIDSQKSHFMAALGEDYPVKLIVAANDLRAREIYDNYRLFDREVMLCPARDFIFYQADVSSKQLDRERIRVLQALAEDRRVTVITTVSDFMNRRMPFDQWKAAAFTIRTGTEIDLEEEKKRLVTLGYERNTQAEGPGQFAIRGNILDIYPLTEDNPVRIELWGDEVDSVRCFDSESQRSLEELGEVRIYPACELVLTKEQALSGLSVIAKQAKKAEGTLRKHMKTEEAHRVSLLFREYADKLEEMANPSGLEGCVDCFFENTQSLIDAFGDKALVFLDEPNRLEEAALAMWEEFSDSMEQRMAKGYALPVHAAMLCSPAQTASRLSSGRCVGLCMLENAGSIWSVSKKFTINARSVSPYNNRFELLVKDLQHWKKEGCRVILLCASRTRGHRLSQDLMDEGLTAFYSEDEERTVRPGEILVTAGSAHRGYEYPLLRFLVISETDIFGQKKPKKRSRQRLYEGSVISNFADLHVGDYVVHESRGLGIYRGIEKIEVNHVMKDYMKLEYQGGDFLYVLASSLDVIQKYAGADAKKPKLNKLGGNEWNRTRARVKSAVGQIAEDLVRLYAARMRKEGFACGEDTVWQKEFEELFPFEETEDQLEAIEETKKDMQSSKIMDRLICGDVGYGKTEIALRAAFKEIQEGRQVAYLVPTTILAQQHYNTFVERMKDYPVRVDLLCRFSTPTEQKRTVADLKRGVVDVVIGTHRLLSKDVQFRQLGLLVVDEEQRFGVAHKEKIKHLKENVDVLTLTATPIPRTLHMSLIGIRDMSVLSQPPLDRQPVQTFVMEYNEELVREAICREIARGGQVYYVYNRVNTIIDIKDKVARLVPQARVAFAHGQMNERELEGVMYDFINGDIDVLVSTTIVETGLDIPNANTMIIHDADEMGLSQLYQLRGRIGRSSRSAYAFLMYRRNRMLKETAEKRLSAIREFTELGSGFKVAMRDLEIRGAGNLLGSEQHGHMEAVGYDLYCKLLNEAVRELKGEKQPGESFETSIDMDMDAFIPEKYIRSENLKLDIYKRIAAISSQEEYDDMVDELIDRFGQPPKTVMNLLGAAMLKTRAHSLYLTEVTQKGDEIRFVMYPKAPVNVALIDRFVRQFSGRMTLYPDKQPMFLYRHPVIGGQGITDPANLIRDVLDKMELLYTDS